MSLQEQIEHDIKTAMKAGEKDRVSTLRMLKNMLHNQQIEKGRELKDDEVEAVIQTAMKQRQESIDAYEKAGKEEQAQKEADEAELLKAYLPEQLSDEELDKIIDEVVDEFDDEKLHQGKVIGAVIKRVGSRADGKRVASRVNQKLDS